MDPRNSGATRRAAALFLSLIVCGAVYAASDVVTVGTKTASGSTVDVPVSIRDVSGTSLGMDQPAGSKIQSFSIKVDYAPASAVQSVSFSRAGITASLSPTSEFKPSSAGSVSLLATFQESTNLIPFTSNASVPGDLVAHLVFTLSPSATPGSTITLTLDPSLTQLTDAGGTAATKETAANGGLTLVSGQITVPTVSVSLSPASKTIPLGGNGNLSAVLSAVSASDTTVTLSSNNTSVATVPSSVVVPAGTSFMSFRVTTVALGTARITATLGSSLSNSNVTVTEPTVECAKPSAPQLSAPASAAVGTPYTITWNAVSSATEYVLEESADAEFTNPTSQTLAGTSATFSHDAANRYYYRVRARNREGTCDVFSNYSTTVSVLLSAAPTPLSRVLAVVGSLPGNFGSFFRTAMQLYNPHAEGISGKLVFHTAGANGSAGDPSMPYSIAAGRTLAFGDLLPAMGLTAGLGSVDLIADGSAPLPVALARVFNDGGAAGTTGFAEEALSADDALQAGATGVLLAPPDVQRFRLNIGVRTLEQGATLVITVRDKEGLVVKTRTRDYGPVFFEQVGSSNLLEGYALTGGETLTFAVTSGGAFVYGSTIDNTTNDPSVQFARRLD